MATRIPDTDSEIDLKILRKKSDSAGYIESQADDEASAEETYRYWPLTRISILEGLQDDAIDQKV